MLNQHKIMINNKILRESRILRDIFFIVSIFSVFLRNKIKINKYQQDGG